MFAYDVLLSQYEYSLYADVYRLRYILIRILAVIPITKINKKILNISKPSARLYINCPRGVESQLLIVTLLNNIYEYANNNDFYDINKANQSFDHLYKS
jgi:hypothetical protein